MVEIEDIDEVGTDLEPVSIHLPAGYSDTFTYTSSPAAALEECFGAFSELCFWVGITRDAIHFKVKGHHKGAMHPIEFEFLGMIGGVHTTPNGGQIRLRRLHANDMIALDLL